MRRQEVELQVEFTEGYEKRYTEVCLEMLDQRRKCLELLLPPLPSTQKEKQEVMQGTA